MTLETATKLEASRKELLDLGLRNPLLNFRSRTRRIDVVEERSSEVFHALVVEGKKICFAPAQGDPGRGDDAFFPAEFPNQTDDYAVPFFPRRVDEAEPSSRQCAYRLQTRLTAKGLHARLLSIRRDAQTYFEEQGVNILYLALGFLHWYETSESTQERLAPLILVPVELARGSVAETFTISHPDEDIGENLSLIEKLRTEFGIRLPPLGDPESLDVNAYHQAISEVISTQPRWRVVPDEIVLGFYSFGKFLMYKDLDPKAWPAERPPQDHPILHCVLETGFREPPLVANDDVDVDEIPGSCQLHQILPADSSQILTMLDVNAGRNMVIEGPPGTGKSQTIANIIAESICQGKKVLFVSEKMAALEVVKRRLDQCGLGVAVLELHSHKTRKREVLEDIRRTLEAGRPQAKDGASDAQSITALRDRLNDYCKAINTRVEPFGVRPIDAIGHLLLLRDTRTLPQIDFATMRNWNQVKYLEHRRRVDELQRRLQELGVPKHNSFWGVRITAFLRSDEPQLQEFIGRARGLTAAVSRASNALAARLLFPEPKTLADVARMCRAAMKAAEAPDVSGIGIATNEWRSRHDDVATLMETGRRLTDLHHRLGSIVREDAWDSNLFAERQDFLTYGQKWWRYLSSRYRFSRSRLAKLLKTPVPKDAKKCIDIIDGVIEHAELQEAYKAFEALGAKLFGRQWRGRNSDWDRLARLASWIAAVHADITESKLPNEILAYLQQHEPPEGLKQSVESIIENVRAYQGALKAVEEKLAFQPDQSVSPWPRRLDAWPLCSIDELLGLWQSRWNELRPLVNFNAFGKGLRELGLGAILDLAEGWEGASRDLIRAFDAAWYEGVMAAAYRERPGLQLFDCASHEHAAENFRALDRLSLDSNVAHVAMAHWSRLASLGQSGQMGVIYHELNKKRRHLPIRQLVERAGTALQAIKPVFMMSPLSIANFLQPSSVEFDLVLFDEASQVKPVDAFGALLRAKQAVVVGDSRQLPPTNFFEALADDDEPGEENNVAADMESILSMFRAQGARSRMLRWHYRSRHESLIAVSNHEFYDNKLVIFPSPDSERQTLGLRFHHLPKTAYGRGGRRTNSGEALAVAQRVMWYARHYPELTLGVAAFSVAQRDEIESHLEILRQRDPSLEDYFTAHPETPFFVKNLENLQGDERDIILISIGYGKTKEGYMTMSFGPLNQDGGERRLNVLITRAKCICEVFANFTAEDIDLQRTSSRGVAALKTFLTYARDGRLDVPTPTGAQPDSPFEEAVLRALGQHGYEVHPQVGTGGFRIDLAVVDDRKRGRYLLGIECDGASYHSARSARDRDWLRQMMLEELGWRIHRVWSTDWFTDPEKTLRRAIDAIERAQAYWAGKDAQALVPAIAVPQGADPVPVHRSKSTRGAQPDHVGDYRCAEVRITLRGQHLHKLPVQEFAKHVEAVVDVEGPVHVDLVIRRITNGAGLQRAGSRIRGAIERGIKQACWNKLVTRRGDFLHKPGRPVVVRCRLDLPSEERRLSFVAPEEIVLALLHVVRGACTITLEEAISVSCAMLGFNRISTQMADAVTKIIEGSGPVAGIRRDGTLLVWRDADFSDGV